MSSLNRILLIGSVSQKPDVRVSTSGDPFCNFILEVNRPLRSDGLKSGSDLIKVVAWKQVAEQVGQCVQGSQVLVEGKVQTRKVEDQGQVKYFTEVEAKEIKTLDSVPNLHLSQPSSSSSSSSSSSDFDFEDHDFSSSGLPSEFSNDVKEEIPF